MKKFFCILIAIIIFSPLNSQDRPVDDTFDYFIPEPPRPPLAPEFPEETPRQFRGLELGMDLEDLKTALINDDLFAFRGDRDVSWLPVQEETLVETAGLSYIRRAYFQLIEGEVYIMSFTLDTRVMDHYSVYTAFVRRYGEPVYISPSESVWENENTRVSIERPLTVKYIDMNIFNLLIEGSRRNESQEMLRREEFLADF